MRSTPSLGCYLGGRYKLPTPNRCSLLQESASQKILVSMEGPKLWELGGSNKSSDGSLVDEHFRWHDKAMVGNLAGLGCSQWCVGGIAPAVRGQGPGLTHQCNPLLLAAASTLFNPSSPQSSLLSHSHFVLLNLGPMPLPHQHPQLLTSLLLSLEQLSSWVLTYIAQLGCVCVAGEGGKGC